MANVAAQKGALHKNRSGKRAADWLWAGQNLTVYPHPPQSAGDTRRWADLAQQKGNYMQKKITICDGKYTLIYNNENGDFRALRYGEEWRSLVGDKLVLAMFCELQAQLQAAQQGIQHTANPCAGCGSTLTEYHKFGCTIG